MKEKGYRSKERGAKKPIKVLQVINTLMPGGAAYVAINLSHRLGDKGFHVDLAGAPHPEMSKEIHKSCEYFYPIPELRREINPIYDLKAFIKLYNIISKGGYQVVHTHTSKAGILGRAAARLAGTPVIVHTPHGSIFHPIFFGPTARWFFALIENIAAHWADKIIIDCQSQLDDYQEYRIAPKDKYIVTEGFFDPDIYMHVQVDTKEQKQILGLPEDSFIIGIVGRLRPNKGHYTALKAFQKLQKKIPNAFLLFVGDGELRKDISDNIVQMGLRDRVIMTGYRKDVPEIISILDVSLVPPLWDCCPRSVLEAMSCRVPVIGTSVGGIPEMITHEETGLIIPPGDAEALAHCILRLRNDTEFVKKIKAKATEEVQERFNPSKIVETMIQTYLSLLAGKGFPVGTGQTNVC